MLETDFRRRQTRTVQVGNVAIGSDHPVAIQSMITAAPSDIKGSVDQIINLCRAGADIVRVTVPTIRDVGYIAQIRGKLKDSVALVADVHHQGTNIAAKVARYVDKVRINPGLFVDKGRNQKADYTPQEIDDQLMAIDQSLKPVIVACKENGTAMRIGVNHGSLSNRLMVMYGDTPEGMVESAMEYIKICELNGFRELVISLKASRVPVMVAANRLMVEQMNKAGMDYPLHLGVTEAGMGQRARVKSSGGITTLLMEGIGDTIRVSLSEDPINEISVCKDILLTAGLLKDQTDYIGCPSCGRTQFDLPTVLTEVQLVTNHLKGLIFAVMGCVVNGPGEMADADYGYTGQAKGLVTLFRKKEAVKRNIPQEQALQELIKLLKADGVWQPLPENFAFPGKYEYLQDQIA